MGTLAHHIHSFSSLNRYIQLNHSVVEVRSVSYAKRTIWFVSPFYKHGALVSSLSVRMVPPNTVAAVMAMMMMMMMMSLSARQALQFNVAVFSIFNLLCLLMFALLLAQ